MQDERTGKASKERDETEEEEEAKLIEALPSTAHPLASPAHIAALSPSPFPSASDELTWQRVTDEGDVLQSVQEEGTGEKVAVLHRIYSQSLWPCHTFQLLLAAG